MCGSSSFFFSSRRRHTRWPRDWSSDVCSSDLDLPVTITSSTRRAGLVPAGSVRASMVTGRSARPNTSACDRTRSEERRVGKECRTRWSPDHGKKKDNKIHKHVQYTDENDKREL